MRASRITLNDLIWPEDDGMGHGPDLIVDDGGEMNPLIHEVKKSEGLLLKDGTGPDTISIENT